MMREIPNDDYIVSDRSGIVENRHAVHAAIVDTNGKLLYAVGNPWRLTLARSTAKPAQALAILETPGFQQFGFDDADLALMCASHSSERRHIVRALSMLAKVGADEGDLRCGGHPSLSEAVNRAWITSDYSPSAICNNCSGKHAGMIAGARATGDEILNYHLPEHPIQLQVKRVIGELVSGDGDGLKWGIDGCNLPSPAAPLVNLASAYASFAAAADSIKTGAANTARTKASKRIFQAMVKYPGLVGGEGRFCTELMTAFQGTLIGKLGADGCYAMGIRASDQPSGANTDGALGIMVKIEDGDISILYSAVVEILEQLQVGTLSMRQQLVPFYRRNIFNTAGIITGHVTHQFKVRPIR